MADLVDGPVSDDSFEELSEPKFKYKRILNDFRKIWSGDAVSCFAVHTKFLALGTQWGKIYLLDHGGTIIEKKVISAHTVAVNHINIDTAGEHIASCSNDGKVVIYGLWSSEHSQVLSLDRPIRSVSLCPDYGRQQQFATGDRCLMLHERGLFTRDKQNLVFAGKDRDGYIHAISWRGTFIAFANDTGVRVYDRDSRALVTHVLRTHDLTLRSDLYPAHIVWQTDMSFAVGWAHTLTVCDVKQGQNVGDGVGYYVEMKNMWDLGSHYISGISFTEPLGYMVVLTACRLVRGDCNPDDDGVVGSNGGEGSPETPDGRLGCPRILLLESCGLQDFEILTEDLIEMNDCDKLLCHQYHLFGLPSENSFFIVAPRDAIMMRPCNADDHITWLLENRQFSRALEFMKEEDSQLERHSSSSVGRLYIDDLIANGHYGQAASVCELVCGQMKDLWEEFVTKFDQINQLGAVAPHLPLQKPQLEPECYESVLLDFLNRDVVGFKKLISTWSPDLYRVGAVIKETLSRLYQQSGATGASLADRQDLLETLAKLYTFERNYERALTLYLKLGHRDVFPLIERYRLFPAVKDRIQELMAIDSDLAVKLLLNNEDSVPAAMVVRQLSRQPKLQLAYLDRLFARGEGADFADLAISLYAEHKSDRLLAFLRSSQHYHLDKALTVCRQRKLLTETVFLLARAGNQREALRVIINESKDMYRAIEFCKEHDDADLWSDLISHSISRAEFIRILMVNIGTHVDPTLLIQATPPTMEIPGLREALVKIMVDHTLQISMQESCRRVVMRDCHSLSVRLRAASQRGVRVSREQLCDHCGRLLLRLDPRFACPVRTFACQHAVHENCAIAISGGCPVCTIDSPWKLRSKTMKITPK